MKTYIPITGHYIKKVLLLFLFSLVPVSARSEFSLTTYTGGETIVAGETIRIAWETKGSFSQRSIHISIWDGERGVSYPIVSFFEFAKGQYMWNVPSTFPEGTKYRLRIENTENNSDYSMSSAFITVLSSQKGYPISGNTSHISITPNPASDLLRITAQNNDAIINKFQLTDITGNILVEHINISNDTRTFSLSIRDIEQGCYYGLIHSNSQIFAEPIIIIR